MKMTDNGENCRVLSSPFLQPVIFRQNFSLLYIAQIK